MLEGSDYAHAMLFHERRMISKLQTAYWQQQGLTRTQQRDLQDHVARADYWRHQYLQLDNSVQLDPLAGPVENYEHMLRTSIMVPITVEA
jgi:hypothetical protein